jgi:hypothetical protein
MIYINREVVEANISSLILSIMDKDWTEGRSVEFFHLQEGLEEAVIKELEAHNIKLLMKGEKII